MQPYSLQRIQLDPKTYNFYRRSLDILKQAQVLFLVGGGFAFECYTGITRHTKDLDLFIRPGDCQLALEALAQAGYQTMISVPHWLAKASYDDDFVDLIFNSSTGYGEVNDSWFEHATLDTVLDMTVQLCPVEEMIWSKAFVMARDRFDGADVAHLILSCGDRLDWARLLDRFGVQWRVLFSHLILFGFIYPSERSQIPTWVMRDLTQRLQQDTTGPKIAEKLCQGTLLAPSEYQIDVEQGRYKDARLQPQGNLTTAEVSQWVEHVQQERDEA